MVLIIDERPNRVVKSADMCPGHIGVVVMASVKEHLNNVVQYVGAVGGGFLWVEIGGNKGSFWHCQKSPEFSVRLLEDNEKLIVNNTINDHGKTRSQN